MDYLFTLVQANLNVVLLFAVGVALFAFKHALHMRPSSHPLPPGPRPLPVIGNIFDMPSGVEPWKALRALTNKYGNITFLSFPQQPTIVVESAKVALDLMEKRSQIYSDRLPGIVEEEMGWDINIAAMPYTAKWRNHRRTFHQFFNQTASVKYLPRQLREIRTFLLRALEKKEPVAQLVRLAFAASILDVVYGMDVRDTRHEYFHIAETAMQGLAICRNPGLFWVEYLPILRYLPSWAPGGRYKKVANHFKPFVQAMKDKPFDEVKRALLDGNATPSMAQILLTQLLNSGLSNEEHEAQEEVYRNTTGLAFAAAADTTTSSAQSFLIAMAKYPEVQRKAQAEIDANIGPGRLPEHEDIDSLPYIQAIVMETLRWKPVVPLGFPHRLTADDEYNGFFFPAGTVVIPNQWGMLNDPEDYPDSEHFKPERFIKDGIIDPTVRDPAVIAFGFGRRICPGRHMAQAGLQIIIMSILHSFNVEAARDENGKAANLKIIMTPGLVSMPESVPVVLTPRSEAAERLIRRSAEI